MSGGATTRREGAAGKGGVCVTAALPALRLLVLSTEPVLPVQAKPGPQRGNTSRAPFALGLPPAREVDRHTGSRCGGSAASHGCVHPSCRVYLLSCLSGTGLQRG